MGFFDFLRGSGKQVELKPETLKAEIDELGFDANAYEVLVEDATVTIQGMAGSQQEREKVILALGNVEGVEKVEDQIAIQAVATLPGTNPPQVESRFHTVQSGDTLSKIAREVYGDANAYQSVDKVQSKHWQHIILGHSPRYPPIYGVSQVVSGVYQRAAI